jgi:hypothetical protein
MAQVGELFGVFVNSFKTHREMRLSAEAAARVQTKARKRRDRERDREYARHHGTMFDNIIIYLSWVFIGAIGYLLLRVLVRGLLY